MPEQNIDKQEKSNSSGKPSEEASVNEEEKAEHDSPDEASTDKQDKTDQRFGRVSRFFFNYFSRDEFQKQGEKDDRVVEKQTEKVHQASSTSKDHTSSSAPDLMVWDRINKTAVWVFCISIALLFVCCGLSLT